MKWVKLHYIVLHIKHEIRLAFEWLKRWFLATWRQFSWPAIKWLNILQTTTQRVVDGQPVSHFTAVLIMQQWSAFSSYFCCSASWSLIIMKMIYWLKVYKACVNDYSSSSNHICTPQCPSPTPSHPDLHTSIWDPTTPPPAITWTVALGAEDEWKRLYKG
jgi:hypothetical protein